MNILILSCGRTGTNILLEALRGSSGLIATEPAEHKQLFRTSPLLPNNYLSKCDTCYIDNLYQVKEVMDKNKDLKILWTIRDLRDCALSKIYRGQPGNDTMVLSDDATFKGCLHDIEKMNKIHDFIETFYPDRIMLVKMEEMLSDFEKTLKDVCDFCKVPYEDEMKNFVSRYRGSVKNTKGKRYKNLDKGQLSIHKRKYEIYDGFYKNHKIDLDLLFEKLGKYLKKFNYE